MWILDLHWFQERPADQDPYCLQELIYIWFHTVFERIICLSTEKYKLVFFSLGQVKFSMYKYIFAFYLPRDRKKILLFSHPCDIHVRLSPVLITILREKVKQLVINFLVFP